MYHKIPTVFERDPETKFKTLIEGKFATPELEQLANIEWEYTEKIDGTNAHVTWDGCKIAIGGKTEDSQLPTSFFQVLTDNILPLNLLDAVFGGSEVSLYGEGYGEKIQKVGAEYLPGEQSFILFDVRISDMWLQRKDVMDIASKLNLKTVEVVGCGTLLEAVEMVRLGFSSALGTASAEGLVMRPKVELLDRQGSRIIAKIKHKDFRTPK